MSPHYIRPIALRVVAQASFMAPAAYPCAISRADPAAPSKVTIAKGATPWTRVPL